MYANGEGVSEDYKIAVKWYKLTAEQGHAPAQSNLGVLYDKGWGVPQDDKTAIKWYRLAAKQRDAAAQNNLGVLYEKGQGVPQDYKIAVKWYRLAAMKGYANAQSNLGLMYQYGEGVPKDDQTAVKWFRLAAVQGNALARNNLEKLQKKIAQQQPSPTITAQKPKPKVDHQIRLELARRTQEALQVLGLYSGKLDGIIGVKTRSAIQQWQKRNGYAGTGEVTEVQLTKLEQEAITRLAEKKSEPPKPSATQVPERPDDVAVIIANSNYTKQGKGIPNVDPAYNDAKNIKRYFMEALGVREGNIIYLKDATKAQMTSVLGSQDDHRGRLFNWTKPNVSKVYVYYAGHGAPAGDRGTTYLVPSDTDSQTVQLTGYPLKQLYKNLGKLPATSITVILEACFSGQSHSGHLSVRTSGISIQPKMPNVPDRLTVISAGAANQVASWEQDESQSLFTKYFLKAMSGDGDRKPYGNGDGKVSLRELKRYLDKEMTYLARRYYGRDQNAQITVDGRQVLATN
jgi:peptidoglycan hydrolase-like protein with peptidoglycan-binding domain